MAKKKDEYVQLDSQQLVSKTAASVGESLEAELTEKEQLATEPKAKRKYTRRSVDKEQLAAQEREKQITQFVEGFPVLSQSLLEMTFKRLPNPIPPTREEVIFFNNALTAVAKKRFDVLDGWDAEVALLLVAGALIVPRLQKETKGIASGSGKQLQTS